MTNQNQTQIQCLIFTDKSIKQNPDRCRQVIEIYEKNYEAVRVAQKLELQLGELAERKEWAYFIAEQENNFFEFIRNNQGSCDINCIFFSIEEYDEHKELLYGNEKFALETGNQFNVYIAWDTNPIMFSKNLNYAKDLKDFEGLNQMPSELNPNLDEQEFIDKLADRVILKVQWSMEKLFKEFGVDVTKINQLLQQLTPETEDDLEELITAQSAADMIKTTAGTINLYVRKKQLPYTVSKSGRRMFKKKDILEFFKKNPLRSDPYKNRI